MFSIWSIKKIYEEKNQDINVKNIIISLRRTQQGGKNTVIIGSRFARQDLLSLPAIKVLKKGVGWQYIVL